MGDPATHETACEDGGDRLPAPHSLVIFGATGDLSHRKLAPALYGLFAKGLLPDDSPIIAFARREKTDERFRADLRASVSAHAEAFEEATWKRFAQRVFYLRSTFDDERGYARLKERIERHGREHGVPGNALFYLAAPPDTLGGILERLGAAGLTRQGQTDPPWARVVVEKPFGHDHESACELNRRLRAVFEERQIFRIDHYLGKETVQNILVMRFANAMFEPIWNHRYVDHVQISAAESIGIQGRGRFYEKTGVIRDMLQNHMMHLLCLTAMEPPTSLDANAVRDEKVKLLRALRPLSYDCVLDEVVLGQYAAPPAGGPDVPAYRQEEGVGADSTTPTFVALRAFIENWRWAGVPFYLRTGKALPARITEILVHFKQPPDVLFARLPHVELRPNILAIRIQPNEGISWRFHVKRPGAGMHIAPHLLDFSYGEAFRAAPPEAYQRLLLDAARGQSTLFARSDEVEAAWEYLMPILVGCSGRPERLEEYAAGTWGPAGADRLIEMDGRRWQLTRRPRPRIEPGS